MSAVSIGNNSTIRIQQSAIYGVSLAAASIPAVAATRVDPLEVLRR
jgi:ABC-type lipoprotein release transport system permease subunit